MGIKEVQNMYVILKWWFDESIKSAILERDENQIVKVFETYNDAKKYAVDNINGEYAIFVRKEETISKRWIIKKGKYAKSRKSKKEGKKQKIKKGGIHGQM